MKKLICITPLLFIWIPGIDNPIYSENSTKIEVKTKLTSFQIAFERIHKFEGFYANVPNDKGQETYRGVSRRYNKNWIGWSRIDEIKQKTGIPKWNQQFPTVDIWVTDYYLSLWLNENFDKIQDSQLAAYIFEFRIHGVHAIKIIKRQVDKQCNCIKINNKMDLNTINALNSINSTIFLKDLKKARIQYYHDIVRRDSTQKQFLKHWLSRVNP